ncbi:MAG: ABC transporter ATP-binding protein [Lysobacterales bacterium]
MKPATDIVLSAQGVAKTYREVKVATQVLVAVDLAVRAGEAVAIMGSSGAGKSTLLHFLGGLDAPDAGEVLLAGQALHQLSGAARDALRNRALGFVYQFHHLLPEFSALENVALPLLIRGEPVPAARTMAASMLERVGLGARLEHKPGELSGGERQRAAIARAVVTRPLCLLADEPTGNLDATIADHIVGLLLELKQDMGTAMVVVTHNAELALRMDRVLELRGGRLYPRD